MYGWKSAMPLILSWFYILKEIFSGKGKCILRPVPHLYGVVGQICPSAFKYNGIRGKCACSG